MEGFSYYSGDYKFWHGAKRAALCRAANGCGKTFFYRYDVVTEMNVYKKKFGIEDFPGSEHGADTFHLFSGIYASPPKINSKEFQNVKKFVTLCTIFAISGNPRSSATGNVWEAVQSTQAPFRGLNIGTHECSFMELSEAKRLNVWDTIYKLAGVDLY